MCVKILYYDSPGHTSNGTKRVTIVECFDIIPSVGPVPTTTSALCLLKVEVSYVEVCDTTSVRVGE